MDHHPPHPSNNNLKRVRVGGIFTRNLEGELSYRTALSDLTIQHYKTTHSPFELKRGGCHFYLHTLEPEISTQYL